MTAGRGIFAEVNGRRLLCGNEKFLAENGVSIDGAVSVCTGTAARTGKSICS